MTDVAGYRVLRTASHGARTRLVLGHDEGSTVVLKVSDADDPRFPVEVEALSRAAGAHVVELLDVHRDEQHAVLVLARLGHGTLAELLDRRAGLDAGEAVTILAPIAVTLDRIHSAGVAHGNLSLSTVCFGDDGAPTLVGFGGAELFAAGSPEIMREAVGGVVADRAALRGLTTLVLARVVGTRADAARRLAGAISELLPAELSAALFDLATASPVRFDPDDEPTVAVARMVEVGEPVNEQPEAAGLLPPWLLALMPDPLRARVEEPLARLRDVWSGWDQRRRRLTLGIAAAVVTLVLAFAVLPSGTPAAVEAAPLPTSTATPIVADLPDDPVEAAMLLLELRARCLRDLSLLCLDDVGQPDSAALTDDRMLIRAVEDGGEFPPDGILGGDLTLVERLGDSALIDLPEGSDPASILLMRTAEGWRIRDYIAAVAIVVS